VVVLKERRQKILRIRFVK